LKLLVRKLGLIDHAELDIRPLTVLIGENGTNKTWVAYSLYGLMRSMVRSGASPLPVEHTLEDADRSALERIHADNAAIASTLAQGSSGNVSLERDFSQYFTGSAATRALVGKEPFFRHLLRLSEGVPDEVESRLELDSSEYRVATKPVKIEVKISSGRAILKALISSDYETYEHVMLSDSKESLRDAAWWEKALSAAFEDWLSQSLGDVFVLPAERKTLASAHDLLRDEFGKVVTVPVADYAEFLGSRLRLAEHGFEPEGEFPFGDLVSLLESQVVKGGIGFTGDVEGARFSFSFSPSSQVEIPIHAASSLVRALAGLDLYLQTAKPGDFIVIDELEMNAHPEAQLALTELVAMLVNRGLRVVMTTHSPYIVDHLNNLMAAARVPPERQDELAPHFRLGSREAFLPADKVAAYHFAPVDGKVEVRDVLDRETEAIDWRTFSRVTDELSNLYGRILEAKERE
jgi:AAA domain, putative AbiEii toxin, Type IV TA system